MLIRAMDKTIRKYTSFEEMKAEDYREWQALPGYERLKAVTELSIALYGIQQAARDAKPRLQRTLVRVQRPQR